MTRRLGKLFVEGLRVTRAARSTSLVVALTAAGIGMAVIGTAGRTAATNAEIIGQLDTPEARTIIVRDEQGLAQVDPATIDLLLALPDVEAAIGLGPVADYRPSGPGTATDLPVPVSVVYGGAQLLTPVHGSQRPGAVLIGEDVIRALGWTEPVGGLAGQTGDVVPVVGSFRARAPLDFLSGRGLIWPGDVLPGTVGQPPPRTVATVHVLARDSSFVPRLAALIPSVLLAERPSAATVVTSEQLVRARRAVESSAVPAARTLMLFVFAACLVLLSITMFGATNARARDFGRRRALGASRSAVVVLVLVQTVVPAAVGALAGAGLGVLLLLRTTGFVPPVGFLFSVAVLTVVTAAVAATLPAVLIARRDPVRVLRVA